MTSTSSGRELNVTDLTLSSLSLSFLYLTEIQCASGTYRRALNGEEVDFKCEISINLEVVVAQRH